MSAFPYILSIPDGEIFSLYTDRRFTLGQIAQTLDGRRFRFALNGAALLVAGDVLQAPVPVANHVLQTPATAGVVGDQALAVTLGGTAVTANQYQDGGLATDLGTGFGYFYPFAAHGTVALSTSTGAIMQFKRGVTLQVAVPTTANSVSLTLSPYSGVLQSATTLGSQPVGVAVKPIPASGTPPATPQYGWIQVGGPAAVTTIGTVVIGSNVMVPTTTAGGCAPVAAGTTPVIGTVIRVATTTNKSTIQLGGVLN